MLYKTRLLSGQEREKVNRRLGAVTMRAVCDFYQSVYLPAIEMAARGECLELAGACSGMAADSIPVEEDIQRGSRPAQWQYA